MKAEYFLIGIVLIGLVSIGFLSFMGALTSQYGVTIDPRYNSTYAVYNALDNMNNVSLEMESKINNGTHISGTDAVGSIMTSVMGTAKLLFNSLSAFKSMLYSTIELLGLPGYYFIGIMTIIIILIIFSIIRLIAGTGS